jgi:hypothetical protein
MPTPLTLDETSARQVLMLRAFEAEDSPQWTATDREWATRVAHASLGDGAKPQRFVTERARHAMQRLAPRETGVRAALAAHFASRAWVLAVVVAGVMLGLAMDHIGSAQRINLLAPPVWLLVAWNLLVYLVLLLAPLRPAGKKRLRRWLGARWQPSGGRWNRHAALARFVADWVKTAAPLDGARAALLMHLGAAALALGVVGGMYVRGLVLDYRAGWESSFLSAEQVQPVLRTLLAPASALTGIAVPDAAALADQQVLPARPALAPAAPWLHLYAATLLLFVIVPRLLLAGWAGLRVGWYRRHLRLDADDAYLHQLLQRGAGQPLVAWLLPHGQPPSAALALALQTELAAHGAGSGRLHLAEPVPYGEEDKPERLQAPDDATAALLLVDMAATPEEEVHGRWLDALARANPRLLRVLAVDESGYADRMAALPERMDERRQAWRALAQAHGAPLALLPAGDAAQAAHAVLQVLRAG